MAIAPLLDPPSGTTPSVSEGATLPSRRDGIKAERARRRPRRLVGTILSIAGFVVLVIGLWPAQYGGLTGLTVVDGHSMEPTFHTGDLVISVKKLSYSVGDIVSYTVPVGQNGAGGRVIHRIVQVASVPGGVQYTTQGDNNPSVDPWTFGNGDIMGAEIIAIPNIGSVFGGSSSPIIVGGIAGLAVTSILWRRTPRRRRTDREGTAASEQ